MSAYTDRVAANTAGLTAISTGTCPGCEACAESLGFDTVEALSKAWHDGNADSETSFSWSPCDICGSTLGGDREVWHALDANREIVHYRNACIDCVMFLANGDEPEPEIAPFVPEYANGWPEYPTKGLLNIPTQIGSIGDCDPIEYGGGPLLARWEREPWIEHFDGIESITDDRGRSANIEPSNANHARDNEVTIHRVSVGRSMMDLMGDLSWVDWPAVESSIGESLDTDPSADDDTPQARAYIVECVAGYYGWHELDTDPLVMSLGNLIHRWECVRQPIKPNINDSEMTVTIEVLLHQFTRAVAYLAKFA